ncbi:MAG TPA: VWA domain-containing protein [Bryobacteraceae bacterium]|nr:VWA domain-containing protein [Bryobacteraceae bacterium]
MRHRLLIAWMVLACAAQADSPGELVTLNVVALDSHGQPIGDLPADDFQIQDQGKRYKIAAFHKNPAKPEGAAPALGPHEFSNRSGVPTSPVTLILFDLLNDTLHAQGYAKTQLVATLQRLEASEFVYLYLLTANGPYAVHGLPDAAATAAPWTQGIQTTMDDALNRVSRLPPDMYAEDRVKLTYVTLEALASRLAAFPGRKSIVWVSHGVPLSILPQRTASSNTTIDYTPVLRQLSATLERASIAVYPVGEASAISATPAKSDLGAFAPQTNAPVARGTGPQPQQQVDVGASSEGTLLEIAGLTGGRAHLDNDIGAAIRQSMDDARVNYTIAYEPGGENWDGKYHKIRVTCSRRGVRVLSREGYFAYPPQSGNVDQEKAAVDAAAWSPFDAGEIGMRATVSPSPKTPQAVHLQIRINTEDLHIQRQQDRFTGQISVSYVTYDADGKHAVSPPTAFPFRMTEAQHNGALKGGVTLSPDRAIPDSVKKLRIIVYDRGSNAIGALTVPITAADRSPGP